MDLTDLKVEIIDKVDKEVLKLFKSNVDLLAEGDDLRNVLFPFMNFAIVSHREFFGAETTSNFLKYASENIHKFGGRQYADQVTKET